MESSTLVDYVPLTGKVLALYILIGSERQLKPMRLFGVLCHLFRRCTVTKGVGRRGEGGQAMAPIKSRQGAKKGHTFWASFGLSAINQYFLVTLFPHRVNLPAHSNFSVITTYCSEKKTLETFNDISQLVVHCAVMHSGSL